MIKSFKQILRESSENKDHDKFGELFDQHVPSKGSSDTMYGEIIRSVNRIVYRCYNDGDYFWSGYGIETCGDAAVWLLENGTEEIKKIINSMNGESGKVYDDYCEKLISTVVMIPENVKKELLSKKSTDFQDCRLSKKVIDMFGDPNEEYEDDEWYDEDDDY